MPVEQYRLSPYACVRDRSFVDWLVTVNLAHRPKWYTPAVLTRELPMPSQPSSAVILKDIILKANYVATRADIAHNLYRQADEKTMHNVTVLCNWLLQDPTLAKLITHIPGIGWSLGLTDFKLPAVYIPFIYNLRRNSGHFKTLADHAEEVLGVADKRSIKRLRGQVRHLNGCYLEETPLEVQTKHFPDPNLVRLTVKGKKQEYKVEIPTEFSYPLSKELQDYIAEKSSILLQRREKGTGLKFKKGVQLTGVEQKIIDVLRKHSGYVVPYDFLYRSVYPKSPDYDHRRLTYHLAHIRAKVSSPEAIKVKPDLGVGVGFHSINLLPKGFRLLAEAYNSGLENIDKLIRSLEAEAKKIQSRKAHKNLYK